MTERKTPVPTRTAELPATARSSASEIAAFLGNARKAAAGSARGHLILALDATMSRQPTWDLACELQGRMFDAARSDGRLAVQLVYFRGLGECRASRFVTDTAELKRLMTKIDCRGGLTQIGKVLAHARDEGRARRIGALVFVGDALEEPIDDLAVTAGELGLVGVPMFLFQEGSDAAVERGYRELARLTRGAWFRFDRTAPDRLARLLASVAVYATGGLAALETRGRAEDRLLIENLRGNGARG